MACTGYAAPPRSMWTDELCMVRERVYKGEVFDERGLRPMRCSICSSPFHESSYALARGRCPSCGSADTGRGIRLEDVPGWLEDCFIMGVRL